MVKQSQSTEKNKDYVYWDINYKEVRVKRCQFNVFSFEIITPIIIICGLSVGRSWIVKELLEHCQIDRNTSAKHVLGT